MQGDSFLLLGYIHKEIAMGEKSMPLYEKVKTALSADIRTGKYSPGAKIPIEPELEKIYFYLRYNIYLFLFGRFFSLSQDGTRYSLPPLRSFLDL